MKIIHKEVFPSETPCCHAASVAIHNESPVFSWFGGSYEGREDVSIFISHGKSLDVIKECNLPYWNPILFTVKDKLMMFYKVGTFCDRWQSFLAYFDDNLKINRTVMLPAGVNGPVKTQPLQIGNSLLCGSSVETQFDWTSYIEYYDIDRDNIDFRKRSKPITINKVDYTAISRMTGMEIKAKSKGIIQPALAYDGDIIHAFYRSSGGVNKICYSNNNCEFQNVQKLDIDNPNSGIDVKYIEKNKEIVMFYNPSSLSRSPLVATRFSYNIDSSGDNIELNQKQNIVIEEDSIPSEYSAFTDEFSYPYAVLDEDKIHLVYTIGRSRIGYCILEV